MSVKQLCSVCSTESELHLNSGQWPIMANFGWFRPMANFGRSFNSTLGITKSCVKHENTSCVYIYIYIYIYMCVCVYRYKLRHNKLTAPGENAHISKRNYFLCLEYQRDGPCLGGRDNAAFNALCTIVRNNSLTHKNWCT